MSGGYSKFIRLINLLGDIFILNASFLMAFTLKLGYEYGLDIPKAYLSLLLYINLTWLLISFILENYELHRFEAFNRVVYRIIQSVFIHLFLIVASLFFIKTDYFSRMQLILNYTFFLSFMIFWRFIVVQILRIYRGMGYNYRNYIIVGYGKLGNGLLNFFNINPEYGYRFLGFFDDHVLGKDILGRVEDFKTYIMQHKVDEVYLALPDIDSEKLKEIIRFGDNNLVRIKAIPDIKEFSAGAMKIENYGSIPVILNREEPLEDTLNRFLKRCFDLVFSLWVIIFIFPVVVPVIALLIKISSSGPIFFYQKRSGKNGREFWCLKFRTMYVNSESNSKQAARHDSRITPIGSILRKTNLDELPQFINVLWGDMSVVGPRPHMLTHTEYYSRMVDKFMVRHFVKPGITGLAQVKGFRGETKDIRAMINRIRMDIFYVENWSFYLDIKIILLTVIKMLRGDKNAF